MIILYYTTVHNTPTNSHRPATRKIKEGEKPQTLRKIEKEKEDRATANLRAIIPININRPFLDLQGLSKFAMVKLCNFGNDLSLLYAHMMHSLPRMLSQGQGLSSTMP